LRVCGLAVCIELRLQRFLVLLAIWPVARALGSEGYRRADRTACFDGNIREPFRNAYRRFLHGDWGFDVQRIPDSSFERLFSHGHQCATADAPHL